MFSTRSLTRRLVLVGCLTTLAGCSESPVVTTDASDPSLARAPAPSTTPIASIAVEGGFTELVAALSFVDSELDTGLVELFLEGTEQLTVFAPTDEAFEDLYTLLGSLLETEIDEVGDLPAEVVLDVLLYHVTEGRRAANSVVPRRVPRTITSLLGERFRVRADLTIEDGLTGLRDDANIVSADISASNGIIHVIDKVIVPPSVVAALTG